MQRDMTKPRSRSLLLPHGRSVAIIQCCRGGLHLYFVAKSLLIELKDICNSAGPLRVGIRGESIVFSIGALGKG